MHLLQKAVTLDLPDAMQTLGPSAKARKTWRTCVDDVLDAGTAHVTTRSSSFPARRLGRRAAPDGEGYKVLLIERGQLGSALTVHN